MEAFLGQISLFAFGFAPNYWIPCDGRALSIAQNQALYALLGTTFGGDGISNFCVPDLRGRTPLHPRQATPQGRAVGQPRVALAANQIPPHTHEIRGVSGAGDQQSPVGAYFAQTPYAVYAAPPANAALGSAAIAMTPAAEAHENRQPHLALNFCIAAQGIWPPRE